MCFKLVGAKKRSNTQQRKIITEIQTTEMTGKESIQTYSSTDKAQMEKK